MTINNPYLNNVKIVGPSEVVSELTAGDIVAEVDVSDREVVTGQIKVPVQVYVPNKGTVWAVSYTHLDVYKRQPDIWPQIYDKIYAAKSQDKK